MPNYYPPATSAGGGGTPDDNSVTSAKIADGAIVNADINAAAAIAYSKLALAGSIVTGDITDGTILGGDLSSTIAIPSGATGTTQSATDGSTKFATTAYADTADALRPLKSTLAAKGSIYAASAASTPAELAIGTNLTARLVADSSQATGLKWVPHIVTRTGDATAINSGGSGTALTSDDTLLFAIGASETWYFQANIIATTANTTMDLKIGLSLPASATADWGALGGQSALVSGWGANVAANTPAIVAAAGSLGVGGANNARMGIALAGVVQNSTNAGNVNLQFAQNTADASNLVIKAFSHMIMWRLA